MGQGGFRSRGSGGENQKTVKGDYGEYLAQAVMGRRTCGDTMHSIGEVDRYGHRIDDA